MTINDGIVYESFPEVRSWMVPYPVRFIYNHIMLKYDGGQIFGKPNFFAQLSFKEKQIDWKN